MTYTGEQKKAGPSKLTQNWPRLLKLTGEGVKSYFLLVFHRIKKLSRDMADTKRPQLNF